MTKSLLPVIAAACLLPAALHAQSRQEPAASFKVTTGLVVLDVVARDHSGRPVTDLKPEEIQIREDKAERPLHSFELQSGSQSREREDLRQQMDAALQAVPSGAATNLRDIQNAPANLPPTVLLIDGLNTPFQDRAGARREMLQALTTLDPRQPVAIYALANDLRLLQDFTTDPKLLCEAIARLDRGKAAGGIDDDGKLIDHSGSDALPPEVPLRLYQLLRSFEFEVSASQLEIRVQKTLGAMNAIAHRLSRVPGRKNLIWLSSMFPLTLMPDDEDAAFLSPFGKSFRQQLVATTAAMDAARIAVYPVDAGGLRLDPTTNIDVIDPQIMRRKAALETLAKTSEAFRDQRMETQAMMNTTADRTGGRVFSNRNDLGNAVIAAIEDGAASYVLSFRPASAVADGKFHPVRISTTRKGVDLAYRHGYVATAPAARNQDRDSYLRASLHNALLQPDSQAAGMFLFALPADAPDKIELGVNAQGLTIQEGAEGRLRVEFAVEALQLRPDGTVAKNTAEVLVREFSRDDLQALLEEGIRYRVARAAAARQVRFGVCDLPTGRTGIVDLALTPESRD